MSKKIRIKMKSSDSACAYFALLGYPEEITQGVVRRSVSLDDLYAYEGPRVQFDFDEDSRLIGIEIVVSEKDDLDL